MNLPAVIVKAYITHKLVFVADTVDVVNGVEQFRSVTFFHADGQRKSTIKPEDR